MSTKPKPDPAAPPAQPSLANQAAKVANSITQAGQDIFGVTLIALASMTLLALYFPPLAGGALAWWGDLLKTWFGLGAGLVALSIAIVGLWALRPAENNQRSKINWRWVLAIEVLAFSLLALFSVLGGLDPQDAGIGLDGGRVGWGLAFLLYSLLALVGLKNPLWLAVILMLITAWVILVPVGLARPLATFFQRIHDWLESQRSGVLNREIPPSAATPVSTTSDGPTVTQAPKQKRPILPPQFRKNLQPPVKTEPENETSDQPAMQRDARLPPMDLLVNEQFLRPDERHINQTAGLIEKTLSEFGIPAKVVGYRTGPTVTQYAVEPGFLDKPAAASGQSNGEDNSNRLKVRVAQISALNRDLALALSANRLRIEAPVPGRPYVGIEVPNARTSQVRLRPILESEAFQKLNAPLGIGLGRDVSGQPVVADLTRMPHLLVAGTTGSGKSVCIATITTCLVMNNTPDSLRLVMVDPKMVELVRFNGLPHLMGKVETQVERILAVLRWTVSEMDRRYKLLEAWHARNIDSYNRKVTRRKGEKPLPRIVVMIDELADLMMTAPDQTEHNLVRLAQMARATGIHLVVATQRPSTDVVTGLIKANFPARIAFSVAAQVDSRVILDTPGAESLLGRGDMLFLPPEVSAPLRAQGAWVTDQEIERLIQYWRKTIPPTDDSTSSPWDAMLEEEATLADRDNLIDRAIVLVRQEKRASASMLQRRLRIGYPRAARLIEELEELGVVGPSQGGGREREVIQEFEEADSND